MGIFLEIVELPGRPLEEAQLEEWPDLRLVLLREDQLLDRRVVDIAIGPDRPVRFRIASRPEVGLDVANIEMLFGSDGTTWIGAVSGADVGMSFALEEDRASPGGFAAGGQGQEGPLN